MEDGALAEHEIEVVAGPDAAALARAEVSQLDVVQLQPRIADVELAISEIVTNAVRHGGLREGVDPVRITVEAGEDSVTITVEQPTIAEDVHVTEPHFDDQNAGGFGLRLVEEVADSWGHEPGPPGRVWMKFHRHA
jgi:anti-sigma regulatory factor (Ser/Thr protein kinase)